MIRAWLFATTVVGACVMPGAASAGTLPTSQEVFSLLDRARQPCARRVRGTVSDASTRERIGGAELRLDGGSSEPREETSRANGSFELDRVCAGHYQLRITAPGYLATDTMIEVDVEDVDLHVALAPEVSSEGATITVVVPTPQRIEATAASTLTANALRRHRGRPLADTLASTPGVAVLRGTAGGLGIPIIRGHAGRRTLLLYDRVRHESHKWGIDHHPELDPFAADSITVIRGAGAIRHGPDAIGGVVLLDPPPLPRDPGVSGEVHLIGATNGLRGTTAARLQGAHERIRGFGWRVEGNAGGGAALRTPGYPLDNTGFRTWNAGATLGYERHGFALVGSYRHHDMTAGIFSGLRIDTLEDFQQAIELDRPVAADLYRQEYGIDRPFQRVTHDLGIVRGRVSLGHAGELFGTYSVQRGRRDEYEFVRATVVGPQVELGLLTHATDLRFEHAPVAFGPWVELRGELGGSYARQTNDYQGSDPGLLPDYVHDAGGAYWIERIVLESAEIEGGLRYDAMDRRAFLERRTYLSAEAQGRLPSECNDTANGATCSTSFHAASGSLGLILRPVRRLTGKVHGSTAVRFPSVDEQYMKGSTPSFPVLTNGDATLARERTWGADLGLAWTDDWGGIEGAAFVQYIRDYIYARPVPASDDPSSPNYSECAPLTCGVRGAFPLFTPTSVDALFYGGELSGSLRPRRWPVGLDAQASFVRGKQVHGRRPLVFVPPDRLQLGATWYWPEITHLRGGFLRVNGTFVARARPVDLEADFAPPPAGYALLGAAAGFDVPFRGQRLSISLVGTNLTHARYRDYTSLLRYFADEPGWEVMLQLGLDFDIAGTPTRRASSAR